jgi:cytochrome c oxidase subunit 2
LGSIISRTGFDFRVGSGCLYFYLIAISVFFTVGIVAAIFFFFVKYREKEKFATGAEIHGSIALETVWSIIPFVISMTIFLGGAIIYFNQYRPPADTMEIYVVGKQWMWKISARNRAARNQRAARSGRSQNQIDDDDRRRAARFLRSGFRTKMDVVPGRYTTLWFEATKPGKYHLFCAEYCGLNHSGMGGWVYVMEQRDFDNWLSGSVSGQTPVKPDRICFKTNSAARRVTPRTKSARRRKSKAFTARSQTGERANRHRRRRIYSQFDFESAGQIVEGYQPIMPTFKGQVTEEQLVRWSPISNL